MKLAAAGVLLVLSCWAGEVQAHAPLARELVLASDDGGVFVRMPGFGWLVRSGDRQPFAYACDALWGVQPEQSATPMVRRADGALLVGTATGLRAIDARGCPLLAVAGELGTAPISALAVAADGAVVFAAVAGTSPALYRSEDGGESWVRRAALPSDEPVTALRLASGDPERVYVSAGNTDARAALLVSTDGGASLLRVDQARALVLLDVATGAGTGTGRLWAMARAASGQRGADILRAEHPEGPWSAQLRVNFYGGFALEPSGVIWVGDEGGGVFRSEDGGDHFAEVAPKQAVACLAYGTDGLWACTPGTTQKRAVARAQDSIATFADVVSFAAVDHLVECGPELDVSARCAAAWNEWRVDVRMMASTAPSGSSSVDAPPSDAGGADDAGAADAGATPQANGAAPKPGADAGGCAATGRSQPAFGSGWSSWGLVWLALVARRRRSHVRARAVTCGAAR